MAKVSPLVATLSVLAACARMIVFEAKERVVV